MTEHEHNKLVLMGSLTGFTVAGAFVIALADLPFFVMVIYIWALFRAAHPAMLEIVKAEIKLMKESDDKRKK